MPKYKLTYFNAKARAEVSRYIFAVAGQKYEDVRIESDKWMELKPKTLFGQLPLLEVDGVTLCQSLTISRFLAKRFKLMGKTDLEEALVNMIVDCGHDMWDAFVKTVHGGSDADREAAKVTWEKEQKDQFLAKFEKFLSSNKGGDGYFVGKKMTLADLYVTSVLALSGDLTKYPKLKALKVRVESNHGLAKWLKSRPDTVF